MQKTVDMHCDALTARPNFDGRVTRKNLKTSGSMLQCLAIFTPDESVAAYAAALKTYQKISSESGFSAVRNCNELQNAQKRGETALALTAENIGFTYGRPEEISRLSADGVIMASLVWNTENTLACPNIRADGARELRGLKEKGRAALAALDKERIIVDISHLSDGGAEEILQSRKIDGRIIPVVASHSNCAAVCPDARNLTDRQLKLIADCGGAVGINFYSKFLGLPANCNISRDQTLVKAYEAVAAHLKHVIKIAGEDTPALGSDWDGVPAEGETLYPEDIPCLFEYLHANGFKPRIIEKFARENFLRVFREVRG